MLGLTKKFLISTSVIAGMSAVVGAPAMAAGFSASGTAGTDYFLYKQVGANTVLDNTADLNTILQGNSSAPGGNVELGILDNNFNNVTTLSGDVAGKTLTLSNLTAADWTEELKTEWFDGLWGQVEQKKSSFVNTFYNFGGTQEDMYNLFGSIGGFERSSDPNISYINANNSNIDIGLAGHYNLDDKYGDMVENAVVNAVTNPIQKMLVANLVDGVLDGIQASEVVKYEYGGDTGFLYSFFATDSGLVEIGDGKSHTGNYEVSLAGVISPEEPKRVPEPSAMLGLMAIGGLFAASKRNSQKKA
ncbi:MAG: NF038130 family PEP-CTERM protein [Microcoleaceae cyanobacterium]